MVSTTMEQRVKDWNKAIAFKKRKKMTDEELARLSAKLWGAL